METATHERSRPLIFGEVLFDCFPNGTAVLGGAPFNVAWHLQGFGLSPLFISRIGTDEDGDRVIAAMSAWGMDLTGMQRDSEHATGRVMVTIADGQPTYEICDEQAFDYIEAAPIGPILTANKFALLYHGSLVLRHDTTRATLHWLASHFSHNTYVDINLRPPWCEPSQIEWTIKNARWLKLSRDELDELTSQSSSEPTTERALTLFHQKKLEQLVLTQGSDGASLFDGTRIIQGKPPHIPNIKDTVGAGDAFSAVNILGLIMGWSTDDILRNALEFSAEICAVNGATVRDQTFYSGFINRWTRQ